MKPDAIAADADAFLESEVEAGRFRGAVLLAMQGEVLLRSGYGFANEEWRLPNSPTTKFRIGPSPRRSRPRRYCGLSKPEPLISTAP